MLTYQHRSNPTGTQAQEHLAGAPVAHFHSQIHTNPHGRTFLSKQPFLRVKDSPSDRSRHHNGRAISWRRRGRGRRRRRWRRRWRGWWCLRPSSLVIPAVSTVVLVEIVETQKSIPGVGEYASARVVRRKGRQAFVEFRLQPENLLGRTRRVLITLLEFDLEGGSEVDLDRNLFFLDCGCPNVSICSVPVLVRRA